MDSGSRDRDPSRIRQETNTTSSGTRYEEPFGWWGYHWSAPEARSLVWLIEAGALDERLAAFLSMATELRRSIIVVANPPEAGKTTLLTALLDFRKRDSEPIYLRGWYERFSFLETTPPERAYLLCNEISAHLPTYLWGQGVRRVFEAGTNGYAFVTTMHAGSAQEAIDLLTRYPLEVPTAHVGAIDLIVTLDLGYVGSKLVRRVMRVDEIDVRDDSVRIAPLSERPLLRATLEHRTGRMVACIASWAECSDDEAGKLLSRRERLLRSWLDDSVTDTAEVRARIQASRAPG